MPKYRPESRSEIKRKVKDLDYKAKDRTKHMGNVVKDNKVITDISKKLRLGGTIEGAEKIKQHLRGAGKESINEWGRQEKKLENIVNKEKRVEKELGDKTKDSMQNYEDLTKASSSIKETSGARKKINEGRKIAQEDASTIGSLRDRVRRNKERRNQDVRNMRAVLKSPYVLTDNYISRHKVEEQIDSAIDEVKRKSKERKKKESEDKIRAMEGQVIPQENQGHKLCPKAEKEIGKANAAKEELEAKLKDGLPIQDGKQVQVADEISKQRDLNYGRRSMIPGEQNDTYKR